MKTQKKGLIRKSWCVILVLIGIISLIGTPSIASFAERSNGLSTIPVFTTPVEKNNPQSNDIAPDNPGTPTFDDPWEVTLNFIESVNGKQDTAVFGEATGASDGKDTNDVPKPGTPPAPYLYAYFDAGLPSPYDKLWEDYRHYPGSPDKIWDLYVIAFTTGPTFDSTDITISWNKNAINTTEYQHIDLYLDTTEIANMLAVSTVKFTANSEATNHLQIKCHVNQAPVVSDIPDQTVPEGSTFAAINLDNYVSDVENTDDQMTWTYSGNSQLTVSIVNRVATITIPNADWYGSETITFKATDPDGLWDDDAALFTVTAENDPPVVADIPDQMIVEGSAFATINLDDYVTDVDNTDAQMTWTYSGNSELTVSIVARVATITIPSLEWNGAETIIFKATDPDGLWDDDAAVFTVTTENDPPVVGDIPDQTIAEGSSFATIAFDDYVNDPDNLDSEIIWTYSGNTDLIVTIIDRIVTIGIPGSEWNGAETITFKATDPAGLWDDDAATFTVTAMNDPPTHANPLLISEHGTNTTNEKLICSNQSTNDVDGDTVYNTYHWLKNEISLTNLLLPFNTANSTNVKDYSGYKNNGTITGATWTSSGKIGGAYYLDGTNDYISIPDASSLDGDGTWTSMTMELWVKPGINETTTNKPTIIEKRGASTGIQSYQIGYSTTNAGRIYTGYYLTSSPASYQQTSTTLDTPPLNKGSWYHVVSTYKNGDGIKLFVNGSLYASLPTANGTIKSSDAVPLIIGKRGQDNTRFFNGTIDEVKIYPYALTQQQISQNYNDTKNGYSNASRVVKEETSAGDIWRCDVTPSDLQIDGITKQSNTLTIMNQPPVVSGIPDQTIAEGSTFATINLDDYVTDVDNTDAQMTWTYSGNSELTVSIVARVATITLPNLDWNGAETIVFKATDPGSLFDSDAALFTVITENDPPVVSDIPDQTIAEGSSFATIALDDYVNDPDNLDSEIIWTYSGNTDLIVTISDRVVTIGIPSSEWNGVETITFKATDPDGLWDDDAAVFTVTVVNDPPVVSGIPDQTIAEGSSFATIALDDYVNDPDNLDSEIIWTYSGNTDLIVTISDRVVTIGIPSSEWNGVETITFKSTDPDGLWDDDAAVFTVTAVNDPPVISDIPDQTIAEGSTFATINLDDYVTDVDNTDVQMTWTYSGNSELMVSIVARVATITLPSLEWNGAETIIFKATDPDGLWDDDAAVFTVTVVNDPPVISDIPDQTIVEGSSFATIALDDYVNDPDNLDSEIIWTYSGNTDLIVTISDRVVTIGIPSSEWNGVETITFKATDLDGLWDDDAAVFTVTAVNDPPIVSDIPDQMINQGEIFATFDLDNYVTDVDNTPAEITWGYSGNTELTVAIDTDTHVVTITMPTDWSGGETITFTATDPSLASDSDDATFTVIQYHSIDVKTHWNLISIPVYDTISKADIIVRYDSHDHTWAEAVSELIVLDTLYDWQRGPTQAYAPTDTLVPGNGYWMWAYHDCELRIASDVVGTGQITDIQAKWNIMGLPYEDSLVQTLLKIEYPIGTTLTWNEAVSGNIILGFIYGWDSDMQIYSLETTLEPGQGYWMYAYHNCILKE